MAESGPINASRTLALAEVKPGAPAYVFDAADAIAVGDRVVRCGESRVRLRVGHEPSDGVAIGLPGGGRVYVVLQRDGNADCPVDGGKRADEVKNLGGPHIGGA